MCEDEKILNKTEKFKINVIYVLGIQNTHDIRQEEESKLGADRATNICKGMQPEKL